LAVGLQELHRVGLVEVGQLRLDLGAQHDARRGRHGVDEFSTTVLVRDGRLVDVEDVDEGLVGEQVEVAERLVVESLGDLGDDCAFVEELLGLQYLGQFGCCFGEGAGHRARGG